MVLSAPYDSHLYGLDAKTGKPRWKVQTNGMVHATPAVQNGVAFIAGCDAILRAIRVTDGKEVYQIEAGAYTGASPLIDGDRAYFGTFNNEVLAFDLERKRRVWRYAPRIGSFPSTRRRPSATAASSSAAATSSCTRSTRRPAKPSGRSRRARASTRRR